MLLVAKPCANTCCIVDSERFGIGITWHHPTGVWLPRTCSTFDVSQVPSCWQCWGNVGAIAHLAETRFGFSAPTSLYLQPPEHQRSSDSGLAYDLECVGAIGFLANGQWLA
jgi:hypothetical protein